MGGRLFRIAVALPLLMAAGVVPLLGGSAPAVAAAPAAAPVVIGVDHAAPPGKNWEYTHYFPESGVNVPQGGVVLFQWDQGDPNGFHSVTFAKTGEGEAALRASRPIVAKDTDNGESDAIEPPQTNNPTSATCSTGPQAPPCVYDGSADVSSGTIPNPSGAAFAVQISPNLAPGTYTYYCLVHNHMSGTINVVPSGQPATDAATLAAKATAELNDLNAKAAAAEAGASAVVSSQNADGSRTWVEHVGVTADDVELLEYLPERLPIRQGDSVRFDASGTTQEIHTITTPAAANKGLVPFEPGQCESASGADTPAQQVQNGPPQTGCADPNGFEQPFNIGNQGEQNVESGLNTATSDFVTGASDVQALGAASSHTLTFAHNGTYAFICLIHSHMGAIVSAPGYRVATSNGGVFTQGGVDFAGAPSGTSNVVAIASTFDNQGYWLVTADGHTFNFGAAAPVGNVPLRLAAPIVGAAPTHDNQGLWLVASDGGVFTLGDAKYMGSMGGQHLNAPIVGVTSDAGGAGYTMAASDGGIFNFGGNTAGFSGDHPRFYGSMGGQHLNSPIIGIAGALDGTGYVLAASDGGVFTFGPSVTFKGSLGGQHLNAPIVSIAITADIPSINTSTPGYRMVASDGTVFSFDASDQGSPSNLTAPAVGITGDAT